MQSYYSQEISPSVPQTENGKSTMVKKNASSGVETISFSYRIILTLT